MAKYEIRFKNNVQVSNVDADDYSFSGGFVTFTQDPEDKADIFGKPVASFRDAEILSIIKKN